MAEFLLEIVTPESKVFYGNTEMLIVRTSTGDIAILKDHEPYVSPLGIGTLKVKDGENYRIAAVSQGYMQVVDNKVTLLADTFEWADQIDVGRAEKAKERAEQRLQQKTNNLDIDRAEIALKKALARLGVSQMKK